MKRSFWIGIICAACCLGNIPSSSAVQTASIGSTFSCTFLDSGDQGFFDSSSTHTWDQGQIDAAMRALTTWDSLINPGQNTYCWPHLVRRSQFLHSGLRLFPLLLLPVKWTATGFHPGGVRLARWEHEDCNGLRYLHPVQYLSFEFSLLRDRLTGGAYGKI